MSNGTGDVCNCDHMQYVVNWYCPVHGFMINKSVTTTPARDREQVRIDAAIASLQGMRASESPNFLYGDEIYEKAVKDAAALVAALKGGE